MEVRIRCVSGAYQCVSVHIRWFPEVRISAYQCVSVSFWSCVSVRIRSRPRGAVYQVVSDPYHVQRRGGGEGGVEGVRIRCVSGAYQKVWLEGVYHVCITLVSHLYRTLRISGRIKRFVIQCDTVTESASRCITLYHSCDTE